MTVRIAPAQANEDNPPGGCLRVGLVNNMGEAAFRATERQFLALLERASEGSTVDLLLFTLPELALAQRQPSSRYAGTDTLLQGLHGRLDGLVVTGREPRMPDLHREPYWESFARLTDWARTHTRSTVFSCLAAHAAVLHLDGIERQRSAEKRFGVFECAPAIHNLITHGLPPQFSMPHSRCNGLVGDDLRKHAYVVLTSTSDGDVDVFARQDSSLFLFFQGHPEYEADTLLREYRRDVIRYLRQQADTYPLVPQGYFDEATEAALTGLREGAACRRSEAVMAGLAAVLDRASFRTAWQQPAAILYRNWLASLQVQKGRRQQSAPVCLAEQPRLLQA